MFLKDSGTPRLARQSLLCRSRYK